MSDQRLPIVDADDGQWGDILNQYLEKEHYNTGTDDADNGMHKTITVRAGTNTAGTAPLKFTSGSLLTSPEAGAVEFLTDKLYFTQTTSTTRKTIAAYDDTFGATGDIYYRNSGASFVCLPIGNPDDVLAVDTGLPAWKSLTGYELIANKSTDVAADGLSNTKYPSVKAVKDYSDAKVGHAGIESDNTITDSGGLVTIPANTGHFLVSGKVVTLAIAGITSRALTDDVANYIVADYNAGSPTFDVITDYETIDYETVIPYAEAFKRPGSTAVHTQMTLMWGHGEVEKHHDRTFDVERYGRTSGALVGLSVDASLNITLGGGEVWAANYSYGILAVTTSTRQFFNYHVSGVWTISTHTAPTINNTQYDDGTNLQTLTAGYWTVNYLYRGIEDQDHCYTQLGTTQYATSALAQADSTVPTIAPLPAFHAMFVGRIIVQQGATTGFICESAFDTVFAASTAVTDHGTLSGLGDDDHTQYYNQTRGDARYIQGGSSPSFSDVTLTGMSGNIITSASAKTSIQTLDDSLSLMTQTGFGAWTSGTDAATWTFTSVKFQIDRSGYGYISGKKITWASGQQTATLAPNDTYNIYIDTDGLLYSSSARPTNKIVLFEVFYDGTNHIVAKENHPYTFNNGASSYLHNNVGTVIRGTGAIATRVATGTGAASGDREVKIVGADVLEDHGLTTIITDSDGLGVTWDQFYINGSGKWVLGVSQTQLQIKYNNAGTPTVLDVTNAYAVYTLYAAKDDIESASPCYCAAMGGAVYTTLAAAQGAISSGNVTFQTNEFKKMEHAQLGYAIVQYSATGGYIEEIQVVKSTFNQQLIGGSAGPDHTLLANLDYSVAGHTGFQPATAVAAGTDVDTGTDNVKIVTALAIKNSHNTPHTVPGAAGKIVVSDGTDWITSTPTFPNASASSGKIIKSDGTNWLASTETFDAPGTSTNIMQSDGTNWKSVAAPTAGLSQQQAMAISSMHM